MRKMLKSMLITTYALTKMYVNIQLVPNTTITNAAMSAQISSYFMTKHQLILRRVIQRCVKQSKLPPQYKMTYLMTTVMIRESTLQMMI